MLAEGNIGRDPEIGYEGSDDELEELEMLQDRRWINPLQ